RHPVRLQRPPDLVPDGLLRRDLGERQRLGRADEAVEVGVEAEDAAVVEAEPLPDGVAALDGRVERAHAGLVAVDEATVDVDEEVAVAFVELLEHGGQWSVVRGPWWAVSRCW